MPVRRDGADLILAIRLTPRASRERIDGTFTDSAGARWLQASVTAPPDKGKANAALIALLSARLKLPTSSIFLETGDTNRLKRLRIIGGAAQTEDALKDLVLVIATEERNQK